MMTTVDEKALVIDLDGTLVKTDTLIEQIMGLFHSAPLDVLRAFSALPFRGKAAFKEKILTDIAVDPSLLPYNQELLDYLHGEKSRGRKIYLATASHGRMANAVAEYLDIFDGVFATGNNLNLKGKNKATKLVEEFGENGFVYAGDNPADLQIWDKAAGAITVGKTKALKQKIKVPIVKHIPGKSYLPLLIKQLRVYQWVKNLLVFVPIFASGQINDLGIFLSALICFMAFSFTASGVYIINDLLDLESDRKHARKRTRPFASGDLPLHVGLIVAPLLFVVGIGISMLVSPVLALVVFGYFLLTTWYSVHLKTLPLVDVFTLAALYSVRIVGGGVATDIMPSTWLLSFSGCLFLSLAFLKRYIETSSVEQSDGDLSRRGYEAGESQIQMIMGMAAGFSSVIVFSIWLDSAAFHEVYSNQLLLWMVTPLLLLWQCRLWLAAFRNKMHDDPIVYTARDRISWMIFGLSGVFYGLGLSL